MKPTQEEHRDQVLPESSALIVLLILFGLMSVVVLAVILGQGSKEPEHGTSGQIAYGPADFPEIDFREPLLASITDPDAGDS